MRDLRSGLAKTCPTCGEIKKISEFKDSSLITGVGKICLSCKSHAARVGYVSTSSGRRIRRDDEPSRSDINKLLSFTESPEKYATGTSKARGKVDYLESIQHKFSEGQLAAYKTARKKYDERASSRKVAGTQKSDFSAILRKAFDGHRSVKIRYKGMWRTIDPYSLSDTYVVSYCHHARDIRTFRLDRIQDAEIAEPFGFDISLETSAKSKLKAAPNYRGYGRYGR